jgi:hypothetical protein
VQAQPSKPSLSQGGTISGGSGNTINHTYNDKTTTNFIIIAPTAQPQVTFGKPTLLNEKTQEGYQTHIPLKVISPFPRESLSLVVHVKTLIRVDLSSTKHALMQSLGKAANGQAFISAQNVRGDLTLVIDTSEPINETNPVTIEQRAE